MSFLSKKKVPLSKIIPDNYVDIHSHLIPGIDDGVKTIYQSAYILEQFEKLGIKKVITTPHVMQQIWPNSSEVITNNLKKLHTVLPPLGISKIKLQASAEYMMDDLFYECLKKGDILPLHKNYILVEMSTFSPPLNLGEILFEIKVAGYIPILAHPERYTFYHQNDLKKYDELKQSGFLFQLNLLSVSGFYGDQVKTIANKLIDQNYIDFTGTDIHNYHHLGILEEGFPQKVAERITALMKNNTIFS
ncbi:CpsB/CapC family capsule biosynthesis tyrosine phosphatase [Aquimarina gracilis]|uniref:protein-tyrosine-phosphatase n=1 Tax=Aquimarina gracilis TaxID=874422 RepID=A0ABU6A298_9FLAO|nr:CpsB/CapC family capsule biosynthesis tyrosine phosphatase [Aquimarina gracilis]MEB3348217.1 CpsB/CapC family capsule biosynthesis tyrosine phosphatase [Aquimarina gracilis]